MKVTLHILPRVVVNHVLPRLSADPAVSPHRTRMFHTHSIYIYIYTIYAYLYINIDVYIYIYIDILHVSGKLGKKQTNFNCGGWLAPGRLPSSCAGLLLQGLETA